MNNAKTGQFISEKRKALGLTQQELAEKLQITNKAVSKWETGDGMPDVQLLSLLAKELGTTVDEILNGEEQKKEEPKSPLSTTCLDLPVAVVMVCAVAFAYAFYNVILSLISATQYLCIDVYSDDLVGRLPIFFICLGYAVYWAIISLIFMSRFLKIFDYHLNIEKPLTIVAFVFGFVMLFAQQYDFSPINYGLFMFSFALLLGTFHGYKVPHKVFYGLALLATCVYGFVAILTEGTDRDVQMYIFISRLVTTLIFYILYGLLEKFSNEYEGVEE